MRPACLPACSRRHPPQSIRVPQGYRRSVGPSVGRGDASVSEAGHGGPARNCSGDSGGALMRIWPDRDGSAIGRYLRQRRLRHPQTPKTYRRVLRGFQDVVKRCERSSSRVSQQTLEVWLHERGAEWSASTVLHRACLVDRFLDVLVREGLITSNPVAELRTKYCVKGSETILRAVLAPKPDSALEALRQLPRFGSALWRADAQSRRTDAHEGISLRHRDSHVSAFRPL